MLVEVLCQEQSALQLSEVLPREADIWTVTKLQSTALLPGRCLGPEVTQEESFHSRTREKGEASWGKMTKVGGWFSALDPHSPCQL